MTFGDALGWAACVMTFVTFAQRRMVPLRMAAILANVFFVGYAALGHYPPVLALHLVLLPINGRRLFILLVERSPPRDAPAANETALLTYDQH